MTDPNHRRHPASDGNHPSGQPGEKPGGKSLFVAGAFIVGLALMINKCSGPSSTTPNVAELATQAPEVISTAVATATIPPVAPLSSAATRKGTKHVRLIAVEGLAGEMIYSQNCYDALTRNFSWAKLDTCGAFDIAAADLAAEAETSGSIAENAWFQSETAAERYLKAATSAGEAPEEADVRLGDLQAAVSRLRPSPRKNDEASELRDEGETVGEAEGDARSGGE